MIAGWSLHLHFTPGRAPYIVFFKMVVGIIIDEGKQLMKLISILDSSKIHKDSAVTGCSGGFWGNHQKGKWLI